MSTLMWITTSGLAMSALALTGSLTLVLPEAAFQRLVLPLVALAAGSLLGGALFHMLPESVDALGNDLSLWAWVAGGLFTFFLLEQFLHWHHCHRPVSAHRPIGTLILVADGLHNLIGGLAVGSGRDWGVHAGGRRFEGRHFTSRGGEIRGFFRAVLTASTRPR